MKFPYNKEYFPSAPAIEIRVGLRDKRLSVGPLQAFVDTGADASLIPLKHIDVLDLTLDNFKYLRSQWGEHREVAVCTLDIGIGNLRLPAVEVVADDRGDEVILGRNVLNKLIVTLNGPKQMLEIE